MRRDKPTHTLCQLDIRRGKIGRSGTLRAHACIINRSPPTTTDVYIPKIVPYQLQQLRDWNLREQN